MLDEQCRQIPPHAKQRVLHNRIQSAKFYLKKAGLPDSPGRGRFAIPAGVKAAPNDRRSWVRLRAVRPRGRLRSLPVLSVRHAERPLYRRRGRTP
ncbi:MAG: winged helix-turn-helix domain-containing protein [Parvibaculum sp.]|nr:winged helix-turn-helix domain-containing protein [Parvibaculum sp.]